MDNLIATGLIGISLGSQYALLALGFTLIFGILGVVNFAHGGFYVMGGYVAYYCSVVLGLPFPVAVLAASQPFGLMTAGVAAAVLGQWRFERDVMINGSIAGALGLGGLAGLDLRLRRMPRP